MDFQANNQGEERFIPEYQAASRETTVRLASLIIKQAHDGILTPGGISDYQTDLEGRDDDGNIVPVVLYGYINGYDGMLCQVEMSTDFIGGGYKITDYRFYLRDHVIEVEKYMRMIDGNEEQQGIDDLISGDAERLRLVITRNDERREREEEADEFARSMGMNVVTEKELICLERLIVAAKILS